MRIRFWLIPALVCILAACAQTPQRQVAQSMIATRAAAKTAQALYEAGKMDDSTARSVLALLRAQALAEDAWYDAIIAKDAAAQARAEAQINAASDAIDAAIKAVLAKNGGK